jgi:transposase
MKAPNENVPNENLMTYALGIDVSKNSLEAALLASTGKLHTKSVRNQESGFKTLLGWLERLTGERLVQVRVCLEASGGYEEEAALFLHRQGLCVAVVNPRRTSAYAQSQLRRSKTDRTDAALIARFAQREEPSAWQPPSDEQRTLRRMTRGLQSLKKERDRLKNQLGATGNDAGSKAVAHSLRAVIEAVEKQIIALKEQIEKHAQRCSELARQHELLKTIPGVGTLTAALVLAELGDPQALQKCAPSGCLRRSGAIASPVGHFGLEA